MDKEKNLCNLCGSSNASFLFEAKGVYPTQRRSFRLIKCKSCGLIYLGSQISKDDLESLYCKELHGGIAAFFIPANRLITDLFMRMRIRKIERIKKKGTILDVGCGNGLFLRKMQKRGWDCCGVDISPYALDLAKEKGNIKLFCGELENAELPNRYFDVITFWQSFEHLSKPSNTLDRAHSLLKDDGVLFISVPNAASIEAKINIRKWMGLEVPFHLYWYTPRTLMEMLKRNNFRIICMYKNSPEYSFASFVQSFYNDLGGEHNLLLNLFKGSNPRYPFNPFRRAYTIILMAFTLPFVLLSGFLVYIINIIFDTGSVIEVFAKKG